MSKLKPDKMIQRIQSLYLFLTAILSFLLLNGSFLSFVNKTGTIYKITFAGIMKLTERQEFEFVGKLFPLSALMILIPLLSLITIFLFKNRSLQISLVRVLTGLVLCLLLASVFYSVKTITEYSASIEPGAKMVLPLLLLILVLLAYRGIKKDDELVKSYDRLR